MSNNNGKTYKMGLFGLTATAVVTTVGAGVVTLVGRAVSVTGGSTWLAYLVAILWGAVTVLPFAFVSSALRVEGGNYSTILNLGGRRLAGIYVCSSILMALNWATFGVGLSDYLSAYMPSINKTVIAATCILLFYGLNLLGISAFEKVQSIMTVMLVLMLVFFGLYPVVKSRLEQLKSRPAEWAGKLVFFNAALSLLWFAFQGLLLPNLPEWLTGQVWMLYGAGNLIFILYDVALSRLIGGLSARLRFKGM